MRKFEAKLKLIWMLLTSKTAHVVWQKYPGTDPQSGGFGQGDIRDLVLFSKEIKQMYDGFLNMIDLAATESGELHALQQLRDAVDVIEKTAEKETPDVGN